MAFFTEVDAEVAVLRGLLGEDTDAASLPGRVLRLSDTDLAVLVQAAGALRRCAERVEIVGAGVVASRSTRDAGHSGLAQSRGHRSAASFLQEITGGTRSDAHRQIRQGTSLLEEAAAGGSPADDTNAGHPGDDGHDHGGPEDHGCPAGDAEQHGEGAGSGGTPDPGTHRGPGQGETPAITPPWHAPLGAALLSGDLSAAQHDAILRGLGEPPTATATGPTLDHPDDAAAAVADAEAREAWRAAAEQLIAEAARRTVEELASTARTIRDRLDPEGAERRFQERYQRRSFRTWRDRDGIAHASWVFDDEGAAFLEAILAAALRPRLGPRFVDETEKTRAEDLVRDPRSNDQLAYDLLLDILRTGILADPKTVFGTRQPGIRLVTVLTPDGTLAPTGHTEDGLHPLPATVISRRICDTGVIPVTVDSCGNPLDLGRERRLFTPAQRLTLALRDGGCRWHGCDRPASHCEAHHCDEWHADQGRTDIDRGILLCRFHHMQLHHNGWRITRTGKDDFHLHPPGPGEPIPLPPRLSLRYAWGDIDPPPPRFHPAAA
ncbi:MULTISPECIES: DUF222 domain-containing protein [Microbacterium]|uniref:DUF222 domain-containing protein n=1 Tax=Microbacterium TaxID=33882 RepID=UPI00217DB4F6|nr:MULTISPECIES: DUF222 domain-containing protein [Microbacterium]UWF78140.1 DUF222 domain-containing protein [Microbacterium neungamense]WCM56317.1 DUF222 domain-containing protein [Microbacterium sp. EF45047]